MLLRLCAKLLKFIGLMLPLHLCYGEKRNLPFGLVREWIHLLFVSMRGVFFFFPELWDIFVVGNRFEVETAPAVVFLKDPGVKPVVYHGIVLSFTQDLYKKFI